MGIATTGALFTTVTAGAAGGLRLFQVGVTPEDYVTRRARRRLSARGSLLSHPASLTGGGERRKIGVSTFRSGNILEAVPGDRIPANALSAGKETITNESVQSGGTASVLRTLAAFVSARSLAAVRAYRLHAVTEPGENMSDLQLSGAVVRVAVTIRDAITMRAASATDSGTDAALVTANTILIYRDTRDDPPCQHNDSKYRPHTGPESLFLLTRLPAGTGLRVVLLAGSGITVQETFRTPGLLIKPHLSPIPFTKETL